MKMSNRSKRISADAAGHSRISLPAYCLLCLRLAMVAGSIAMPSIAQSVSAVENTPKALREGNPETSAVGKTSLMISSVAEADRLLKDVEAQRESINTRYKDEEAHCLTTFFVTSCVDDAKERRRVGLRSIRSIEVQANAFKRAYKAEQRDKELQRKKPADRPMPDVPRSEDVSTHRREASRP